MSRNVVAMQRSVKLEVQSPMKLEVLKPSNAANLQNIHNKTGGHKAPLLPNKASITTDKDNVINKGLSTGSHRDAMARVSLRVQQQQQQGIVKSSSIKSSPQRASKSPLKSLTPIRPSPAVKLSNVTCTSSSSCTTTTTSLRSPAAPYAKHSMTRVATSSALTSFSSSPAKCKRRIAYSDGGEIVIPVSRRNARERNRVKMVSQGFSLLRQHVPQAARKKKLSKVETLRCAVEYIRGLQLLLDNHPPLSHHPHIPHPSHPQQPPPSASSSTSPSSAHYQQLHPQVFMHHPHHSIEPHILKLPLNEDTYQTAGALRYDGPAGSFLRSPCESSDISPSNSYYEHKFTPPTPSDTGMHGSNQSPNSTSPTSSTSPETSRLLLGMIKTEEEMIEREEVEAKEFPSNYGREEQDLLEALAWWQHNI